MQVGDGVFAAMSSAFDLPSPRKKHTCSLVTKPARGTGKSEGGMMEARRSARDQPLPLQPLCPTATGTHRGNVDRQRTYQCTREAVSRRTARLGCIIRRPPPRAGRSPHRGSRQSRAGCPAHISLRVRCQGRTGRDDARPIAMRVAHCGAARTWKRAQATARWPQSAEGLS